MSTSLNPEITGHMAAFREAFAGPEHLPFRREGGPHAALLLHGLVGTPAEMAPLAEQLHRMGWTVDVPLLPGHGADIERLFETEADAWVATARESLRRLQSTHTPVLIVGHSMGAAVTLRMLAERVDEPEPCGLILVSPFVRLPFDSIWLQLFGPLLPLVFRRVRPFKTIDFAAGPSTDEIRAGMQEFMPELDIDDPEVQARIRQMEVPTRILGQLERLGKRARQAARDIDLPTLILQGREDEVARPAYSRHLVTQLGGLVSYHEFSGAHNLVRVQGPAWVDVQEAVEAFSQRLLSGRLLLSSGSAASRRSTPTRGGRLAEREEGG